MTRPQIIRRLAARGAARRLIAALPKRSAALVSPRSPVEAAPSSRYLSTAPSSSSTFTTINPDEISHFSRLSSQWWDTKGEFGLLHRMNPVRIEYVRQKVALGSSSSSSSSSNAEWTFETRHDDLRRSETRGQGKWLAGLRVLDVGCGGGLLSESLARLGADVVGVDASQANINIARIHAEGDPFLPYLRKGSVAGSLEYRCTSAETLRDQGEKFDVVCSMEVLEHVDEPGEFLKCLGEMVKPSGHLILSTISRTPLSRLLTLTLAEDVLRLVTPGTHTYSKFVKPHELRQFIYSDMGGEVVWEENANASDVQHGEVGETRGIVYDPLIGGWRLWGGVEGGWWKGLGEGSNYMYSARKKP